jgi:hypothetical protein
MEALLPGSVYSDLLRADRLDDPYYRDNELRAQWVVKKDWEYRRSFKVDGTFLRHEKVLLDCRGLELITRGDNAYRELRSYGQHNVWLCHMGRAALDGSFAEFQEKVLALDVAFEGLAVRCATLRGETLTFDWEGPLLRNGQEQPVTGFKHYENPYCVAGLPASQMEIRLGDQLMRLNFAT